MREEEQKGGRSNGSFVVRKRIFGWRRQEGRGKDDEKDEREEEDAAAPSSGNCVRPLGKKGGKEFFVYDAEIVLPDQTRPDQSTHP